ncbi:MAG: hypothetical protein WC897_02015 [Candidatus Gracilibacteria bacterium]
METSARKFTTYGTSDVQAFFAEKPDPISLSDQDLFLLIRHERVLPNRNLWETYFAEMKRRVDEYNASEPKDKPPYPLRYEIFPPGLERTAIILNIETLDDSLGCPNGCSWCCANAPRMNAKDVIYMPLEQQMHFMAEIATTTRKVVGEHEQKEQLVKGALDIRHWEMGDPLSHPDVIKKIIALYKTYGITPTMPTALPVHATETTKEIFEAIALQQKVERWTPPEAVNMFKRLIELRESLEFYSGSDEPEKTTHIGLRLSDVEKKLKELTEAARYAATLHILNRYIESMSSSSAEGSQPINITELVVDNCGNTFPSIRDALTHFKIDINIAAYLENPEKTLLISNTCRRTDRLYGLSKATKITGFNLEDAVSKCRDVVEKTLGVKLEGIDLTNETVTELISKLQPVASELAQVPGLHGNIIVSHTSANSARVKSLENEYGGVLRKSTRDSDPKWKPESAGVHYFGTDATLGKAKSSMSHTNTNGLRLTPIGLLNTASLLATYEHQNCQTEVPYRGLQKGTRLLRGDNLTEILGEVIIITGQGPNGENNPILILDGDGRLRLIKYDDGDNHTNDPTYQYQPGRVIEDIVIAEHISEIDSKTFRFRGSLMEQCKTCETPCFGLVPNGLDANDF